MTKTRLKLLLAVAGLGLFFWGVKSESSLIRWAGIGVVAVAWLLRFAKTPTNRNT